MGINDRLDMLALQNRGLANTQVVSLVGKVATVQGNLVTVDGTGVGSQVAFNLASDAEKVTVSIRNQAGEVVRTIDVGAKGAGNAQLMWDGRNDAGVVQPAGSYSVTVTAKDAADQTVAVTQETKGTVTAVSFDKGYPVLNHIQRLVGSENIIWAPAIEGAYVISTRGGDFELNLGRDLSIGYLSHTDSKVRLYLEETLTFRLLTAEAAVAILPKA